MAHVSSNGGAAIAKGEYLKKYLSSAGPDDDKRKKKSGKIIKKKKSNSKNTRLKIIDSDAPLPLPSVSTNESEAVEDDDDEVTQPVVALVDDVRVDELKMIGKFKTDSWKNVPPNPPSTTRQRHDSGISLESDTGNFHGNPISRKLKRRNHDSASSDDDLSPRRRHDSDSDISPVRHSPEPSSNSQEKDFSPPRRRKRSSSEDLSPDRPTRNEDNSPLRNPTTVNHSKRSVSPEIVGTLKFSRKTLSGKSAGLKSAKSLRDESEKLRVKEEKMFNLIDDAVSGKNAETVFRNRETGKRRDLKKEKKISEEQLKKQEQLEAKYKLWNKGVKQTAERHEKLEEMVKEAAKPLARYKDDRDLEEYQKQQALKEDPMFEYMEKKKMRNARKAGVSQFPKYSGPEPPPNRFGIRPGYRWDGVDRANGFEQKLVATKNLKKADEEEFYKWMMGTYE